MSISTSATRWTERESGDWPSPTPGSSAFSGRRFPATSTFRPLVVTERWIGLAEAQIKDAFLLPGNWDGQGAEQIDGSVTEHALQLANAIANLVTYRPTIVPCTDGAIAFEWPELPTRPSIVVGVDGVEFCYLDTTTGQYIEAMLGDDVQACSTLLQAIHP